MLADRKDREPAEYLFCYKDRRVGKKFINASLIPAICAKAGVEMEDAKGRITGHRGRSTRLTLLRKNGVSLEDLAEYAGHATTKTIRHYVSQDPLQLHQIIKDAVMYNQKSTPFRLSFSQTLGTCLGKADPYDVFFKISLRWSYKYQSS
ncbi:MAG TPA: site-specific integrase [Ktedonobacteraceae bacterium]|nr:site-specific integrase [Ktedonobacteraceae bacterium]